MRSIFTEEGGLTLGAAIVLIVFSSMGIISLLSWALL